MHRHISAKRSVLWPSKYTKMLFWPGLRPDPAVEVHDAPPEPLVVWLGDTHPHAHLNPLGTFGASI